MFIPVILLLFAKQISVLRKASMNTEINEDQH